MKNRFNLKKQKEIKKTKFIFLFSFLLIIFLMNFVSALENTEKNLTAEEQAIICKAESEQILTDLANNNFSVQRINDSLKEMNNLFQAQVVLKDKKLKYDFSLIIPYCDEIKKINENAFQVRDEFNALKIFYNDSLTEDMNTSSIDKIIDEIAGEIQSERYEKVKPLIDKAYEEIVEVKTSYTTLNLFYTTTTKGIKNFFINNWVYIIILILFLGLFYFFYSKTIRTWWIRRKISNLEIKKNTLKELIQKTQRDYFEKGIMSEGDYTIRTKRFAELIRDIDREMPLLREELMKAGKKGQFQENK